MKLVCIGGFHLFFLKSFVAEFLLRYRSRRLREKTKFFIDALRRTMGVHVVTVVGFRLLDPEKTPKAVW